jgi:TusA-related sulfurtransferase
LESTSVVDGTKKGCTGVIASLQKMVRDIEEGKQVEVLVVDVLTKRDVYEWAAKKGFLVNELRHGAVYRLIVSRPS